MLVVNSVIECLKFSSQSDQFKWTLILILSTSGLTWNLQVYMYSQSYDMYISADITSLHVSSIHKSCTVSLFWSMHTASHDELHNNIITVAYTYRAPNTGIFRVVTVMCTKPSMTTVNKSWFTSGTSETIQYDFATAINYIPEKQRCSTYIEDANMT